MVLAFCLLTSLSNTTIAQNRKPGLLIGANILYNVPQGSFLNGYGKSPGAEVVGGLGLGKTFMQASYGTTRFLGRQGNKDIVSKPITIGIRQFIFRKNLFVKAGIGRASIIAKTSNLKQNFFTHQYGGGVRFGGIEAGVYYGGWNDNVAHRSYQYLQYKIGWNLML